MSNEQTTTCVFCKGTGDNPHFKGTCPVCKGRGKNNVVGKHTFCNSCRGSGQKGGTTLTCYDCGGLGIVPDTRETFIRAREEIKEAQEEIAREIGELTEKPKNTKHADKIEHSRQSRNKLLNTFLKRKDKEDEIPPRFCQCCGDKVNESIVIKICQDCFGKVKELRAHEG